MQNHLMQQQQQQQQQMFKSTCGQVLILLYQNFKQDLV
jgi:hypothetical protein